MVHKYTHEEKHKTGISASVSDFVKHDCPAKTTVWVKGKQEQHSPQVKAEFNKIKGNEEMVPVNTRAKDVCGFCGLSVDDPAFVPCTDEDVEALSKYCHSGQLTY